MRLRLRDRHLDLDRRTGVVAIVNRTPDSFFDGGVTYALDSAVEAALGHVGAGADVIDVGGVRAGPGEDVDVATERERVVPFLEAFRARSRAPVSVDTGRAEVAAAALDAGADAVNDVTGLSDPEVADVVAERPGTALVVMHAGGQVRSRPFRPDYHPDVVAVVRHELQRLVEAAVGRGVAREQIVVDPGHDFGKNTYQSLELTRRLPELVSLGHPVMVALSRKDFLGEVLGGVGPAERREASLAAATVAVHLGAHLVRVHDVAATVAAVRTAEAVLGRRPPGRAVRGLA